MFITTSMPVADGSIAGRIGPPLGPTAISAELCCLKYFDVLGEALAQEIPLSPDY